MQRASSAADCKSPAVGLAEIAQPAPSSNTKTGSGLRRTAMGRPIAPALRHGYLHSRPAPAEPVVFSLGSHAFETDGKDLWVTPPGTDRIDRIKVSQHVGDKSIQKGYPR